ncbi:MAG: hypothetical protein OEQ12_05900 [Nitrosopumilus sp.]|nr:hypothetical protein [Nitrosopumilus sp.]
MIYADIFQKKTHNPPNDYELFLGKYENLIYKKSEGQRQIIR